MSFEGQRVMILAILWLLLLQGCQSVRSERSLDPRSGEVGASQKAPAEFVRGALPSPRQLRISRSVGTHLALENGPHDTVLGDEADGRTNGWVILVDRYMNPTTRPLIFWFSADDAQVVVETQLKLRLNSPLATNPQYNDLDQGYEPDLKKTSLGELTEFKLAIRKEKSERAEMVDLRKGDPEPIRIEPGQTLEVKWLGFQAIGARLCQDGGVDSRSIYGCFGSNPPRYQRNWTADCQAPHISMDSPKDHPIEISGNWWATGYRVMGALPDDVIVTEEISSLQKAKEEGFATVLPAPDDSLAIGGKDLAEARKPSHPYACQGLF